MTVPKAIKLSWHAIIVLLVAGWFFGCDRTEGEPLSGSDIGAGTYLPGIVGGQGTGFNSWKGVLAVHGSDVGSLCTGVLIDPEVLLTARHCVYSPAQDIDYVSNVGPLMILGGADLRTAEMFPASDVEDVVPYPESDPDTPDLALLELSKPVTNLEIYSLRKDPAPEIDEAGIIVGYGESDYGDGATASVHRAGDTRIIDIGDNTIELGNPAGTCRGDSGGPFFTEQNDDWVVTGVASTSNCDPLSGNIHTSILSHRTWIEETVFQITGRELGEPIPDAGADADTDTDADTATDSTDADSDVDTESTSTDTDVDGSPETDPDSPSKPDAASDDGGTATGNGSGCECMAAGSAMRKRFLGSILFLTVLSPFFGERAGPSS